jgi:hypothetical protein
MISFFLTLAISQNAPPPNIELQAAMKLGAMTAAVQRKLPVVSQVVLVPDESTYLDEISKWSPNQRWPVLFRHGSQTSQFIRRFSPEKVWVRESVGKVENLGKTMQETVSNSWGGGETVRDALKAIKLPPIGVVITSVKDTARTAAVALAAGRGQLLSYISNDWGAQNKIMGKATTSALIEEVRDSLSKTGLSFQNIGDEIDAITICMTLPARVNFTAASENPVAVSDVIGRDKNGNRFAWTGWIEGSKANAAYMAMCSLFLERSNYWFCNTYPNNGGWGKYGLGNLLEILPKYGIDTTLVDGTLRSLQEADSGGIRGDVICFTSKGNQDFLEMSDERTSPYWLPILDTPSALYFLHSWSLKNPSGKTTVGGTWLSRGVYAYVGSSHEPMLQAFVPQIEVMRRTMSLVPFLPASRWSTGEHVYSKPWRINTIGDPLMLCPPKPTSMRRIVSPKQNSLYKDQAQVAKSNMKVTSEKPSDESFAKAIDSVVLLGKDDLACGLWKVACQEGSAGPMSASAVLGPMFRKNQTDDFLFAFNFISSPSRLEQDMLWHLAGLLSNTPLTVLVDNLRNPYQADDLKVIADRIARQKGNRAVVDIIDRVLQAARGRNERELKRMRKQYDK